MREWLEDAHAHQQDGYGRAQHLMKTQLPKRFYERAGVAVVEGGHAVVLDGRQTQTPGKVKIVLPSVALAEAMVAEWAAQGEYIDPATMPYVRLLNAALEGGTANAASLREEVVKYAAGDLLLYRADAPESLVAAQEAAWDGMLVRLARHFDIRFQPTTGIQHQEQPAATLARLGEALAGAGPIALTALVSVTGLTGSGLLAVALRQTLATPDEAWAAAHVDEDYNIARWGEDEEAAARRASRRIEFDTAVHVLEEADRAGA